MKISHNKFNNWLDTFVSEKGLDLEYNFEITSTKNKVYHIVELKIIIDYMKNLSVDNKYVCYDRIVKADFKNQNCLMFFGIVAQYIADQYDNVMEGA